MEFDGEFVVDGTPEEVWPYFNDPDILADVAPGCKEVTMESPSRARATVEVGVGSVKPSFDVEATIVECDRPNRVEARASGEASRNAFEVTAWQELTDNGDGTTTVDWHADAEISGIIASLGERSIKSVSDRLVTKFFEDIQTHIRDGTPAEAQFEAIEEEPPAATVEAPSTGDGMADSLGTVAPSLGDVTGSEGDGRQRTYLLVAVLGAVGGLLWARRRDSSSDESADSTEEADETGDGETDSTPEETGDSGRGLRYLLAGIVVGVIGKLLWDLYTSSGVESVEDLGQDLVETADDEDVGDTEDDSSPTPDAEGDDGGAEGDEGMIDDPLDRLS